jgi:hypothetical protein
MNWRYLLKLLFSVAGCAAFVADASPAPQNTWQLPPPNVGSWSNTANWASGLPTNTYGDVAYIDNGGTANITDNVVAWDIVLGNQVADTGRLLQSMSQLLLYNDIYVGNYGSGIYEFSGGEFLSGDVFVAAQMGSFGTLKVSAGTFRPGYLTLGRRFGPDAFGGSAMVVQTGGTVEVFYAGVYLDGDNTTYELRSGTVRARSQVVSGKAVNNKFVQSGGVNDAHSNSGGGYGQGVLWVGVEGNYLATYDLSAGMLMTTKTEVGGYRGQGGFVQTGGEHHVFTTLGIADAEMSAGNYELRGGKVIVDQALNIGTRSVGELSVFGASAMLQTRDLTVGASGAISFSISSTGISPVNVSRNANVTGLLKVFDNGAPPGVFPLINASNTLNFNALNVELPGPNWSWQRIGNQLVVSHVPEPNFLLILATPIWWRIRRFPLK